MAGKGVIGIEKDGNLASALSGIETGYKRYMIPQNLECP